MEKNSYIIKDSSINAQLSTGFEHLPTDILKIVIKSLSMREMVNLQRAFPFFSRTNSTIYFKDESLERDIQYIAPLKLLLVDGYVVKAKDQDFLILKDKRIRQIFYTQTKQKGIILFLTDDNQFFFNEIGKMTYVYEESYHNLLSQIKNIHKNQDISNQIKWVQNQLKDEKQIKAHLENENYIKHITGIPHNEQIKDVQIFGLSILVLTESGKVYAWGKNDKGQLGVEVDDEYINSFTQVKVMEEQKVKQIFLRKNAAWVVTEDNKILACGDNSFGQLGITADEDDDDEIIYSFTPINSLFADNLKVQDILVYQNTSWLITADRQMFACGYYEAGQLGNHPNDLHTEVYMDTFNLIENLGVIEKIKDIVFTGDSTWILTENGNVFAAGTPHVDEEYDFGIDGVDIKTSFVLVPGIPDDEKVDKIISSKSSISVWAITEQGKVYAWGQNRHGQLGTGDSINKSIFTAVRGIPGDEKVKEFIPDIGKYTTWIITENNHIFACGTNVLYQSLSNTQLSPQFIQIKGLPSNLKIKQVVPSNDCRIFVLTKDGQVFTSHADIQTKAIKNPEFVNVTPQDSRICKVIISPFEFDIYYIYFLSRDKKLYKLEGEMVHDLNELVFAKDQNNRLVPG